MGKPMRNTFRTIINTLKQHIKVKTIRLPQSMTKNKVLLSRIQQLLIFMGWSLSTPIAQKTFQEPKYHFIILKACMNIFFIYLFSFFIIISLINMQTLNSSAADYPWIGLSLISVGETRKYTLANLLDALNQKGQVLIDLEQGLSTPSFTNIDLGSTMNYQDALKSILASQGLAYEMHGTVMVIYDKKQRASGDEYALNRKITSLKLSNVSLEECFRQIGKQLHVKIIGGGPAIEFDHSIRPNFDIELNDITLRDALFKIASQSKSQTWNAVTFIFGDNKILQIQIQ